MFEAFFDYKLVPPLLYALIIMQFATAFCVMLQYKMQARQDLGYEPADTLTRNLMLSFGLWLIFRGVCLLHEGSVSANVILLTTSALLWRARSLQVYWLKSRRHAARNIEAVKQAKSVLTAKGKLPN